MSGRLERPKRRVIQEKRETNHAPGHIVARASACRVETLTSCEAARNANEPLFPKPFIDELRSKLNAAAAEKKFWPPMNADERR
jgi:hypothetical protein